MGSKSENSLHFFGLGTVKKDEATSFSGPVSAQFVHLLEAEVSEPLRNKGLDILVLWDKSLSWLQAVGGIDETRISPR